VNKVIAFRELLNSRNVSWIHFLNFGCLNVKSKRNEYILRTLGTEALLSTRAWSRSGHGNTDSNPKTIMCSPTTVSEDWLQPSTSWTERGIHYDRNGNILTLSRHTGGVASDYCYAYDGNRLLGLAGASSFCEYDANGNMKKDALGDLRFSYNLLNLLQEVTGADDTPKAKYAYSADGVKLSVSDGANGYDYLGSLIYVRTNGSLSLERALFDGGALRPNGAVDYFVKDHLGSVRVIVDQAGTVREQNDYYPFGERCPESTYAISAVNRYKYNGKEEQTVGDLGMLDYGARMYQAGIGRWFVPDPLAEKYYSVSPYAYCRNNPIRFVDPDGMKIDTTMLSKDQMAIYKGATDALVESSNLFATMYRSLEQSSEVYAIEFGQTALDQSGSHVSGQFMSNKNGGGTVMFLEGMSYIDGNVLIEELFHAYQHDNRDGYQQGDFNREFEAKVAVTAIGMDQPKGMVFQNYRGMDVFQDNIVQGIYKENGVIIGPAIVRSSDFVTEYKNAANRYAEFNKRTNFGDTHYWRSTTVAPFSLQKLIKDTYSK
jgi:RHS repeat-associated protein